MQKFERNSPYVRSRFLLRSFFAGWRSQVLVAASKSVCICVADCLVLRDVLEKQTAFACVSLVAHTTCFALDVYDVALWKKAEHNEVVRGVLG